MDNKALLAFLCVFFSFIAVISFATWAKSSSDDYMYLVIASKSMQPTFDIGTFITIRTDILASSISAAPYPDGDVIVFYKPKSSSSDADQLVVHRAVAKTTRANGSVYFTTKGDANLSEDNWPDYRGEEYSWNGMISERLLVGKVISYGENFRCSSAHKLGRYVLFEDRVSFVANKTIQKLRDEGMSVQGDPDWLLKVNYTYLRYTFKLTVIDIDWPETTTEKMEGKHDLNVTGFRVMENGTIGERVFSSLSMDQPARFGTFETHDPAFGVGFNPSAFVIGNRFQPGPESELEYTVNRTETLTNTPWGENQTYVLHGLLSDATRNITFIIWCDSESGLVLKQIAHSWTPSITVFEELRIIETGMEIVAPIREIPPPENAAAAVAVGAGISIGLSALMTTPAIAQPVTEATSKLPLSEYVRRFFKFHSEKTFETGDGRSRSSLGRFPFVSKLRIARLTVSALVCAFAFAVVEAEGLLNLLSPQSLPIYLPAFLLSVGAITAMREFFGSLIFKLLQVRVEAKLWLYGIIALIVSSVVFNVAFGIPYRSKYKSAKITERTKILILLSKTFLLLTLLIPFSFLLMPDLRTLGSAGRFLVLAGDAGVLIVTTTVFFSLIPFWPLDGKELLDSDWRIWLVMFTLMGVFFCTYVFLVLSPAVFFVAGIASLCLLSLTLYSARASYLAELKK